MSSKPLASVNFKAAGTAKRVSTASGAKKPKEGEATPKAKVVAKVCYFFI